MTPPNHRRVAGSCTRRVPCIRGRCHRGSARCSMASGSRSRARPSRWAASRASTRGWGSRPRAAAPPSARRCACRRASRVRNWLAIHADDYEHTQLALAKDRSTASHPHDPPRGRPCWPCRARRRSGATGALLPVVVEVECKWPRRFAAPLRRVSTAPQCGSSSRPQRREVLGLARDPHAARD